MNPQTYPSVFYLTGLLSMVLPLAIMPLMRKVQSSKVYLWVASNSLYGIGAILLGYYLKFSTDSQILNLTDPEISFALVLRFFGFFGLVLFLRSFLSGTSRQISTVTTVLVGSITGLLSFYLNFKYVPVELKGLLANAWAMFFACWAMHELRVLGRLFNTLNHYAFRVLIKILWCLVALCVINAVLILFIYFGISISRFGAPLELTQIDIYTRLVRILVSPVCFIFAFIIWVENFSDPALLVKAKVAQVSTLSIEKDALITKLSNATMMVEMGALTAGLSHELNQMLTQIELNADIVAAELSRPEGQLQNMQLHVSKVLEANHAAASLVRSFKNLFYKIEDPLEMHDIDVLVQGIVDLYRNRLSKSKIAIELNLQAKTSYMVWDALLQRVFSNLICNAIDELDTLDVTTKRIIIRSEVNELGSYQLVITDNGRGINPDQADKLFNLLTTSKSSGSGIGLWLSRYLVECHKGTLTFINSPDHGGVSFTVSIPKHGAAIA